MVINIPKVQMLQLQYKLALKIHCDLLFLRDCISVQRKTHQHFLLLTGYALLL